MVEHLVSLDGYDEPGITWRYGRCRCGWVGPFRVARAQAAVDAGWHLLDPEMADFGADWHDAVGEERARLYARFRPDKVTPPVSGSGAG